MEKPRFSISTNVKRGICLFSLFVEGCHSLSKVNDGICFGGGYAPEGSSASFNDDGSVNQVTLRRLVEAIPDPNGKTYRSWLVRDGGTTFKSTSVFKAGEWEVVEAVSDESVSGQYPVTIMSRNPYIPKPYSETENVCIDKFGNVYIK